MKIEVSVVNKKIDNLKTKNKKMKISFIINILISILTINAIIMSIMGFKFMYVQGRIALFLGLKFGLIGLLGIYFIIPLIDKFKNSSKKTIVTIIYLIILLFIIDEFIHILIESTYV